MKIADIKVPKTKLIKPENNEMNEGLKEQIVLDCLISHKYHLDELPMAQRLIRLVRALDSYKKRDSKGRFIAGG